MKFRLFSSNKSKKILIVENDSSVAAMYEMKLQKAGFITNFQSNGKQGYEAAVDWQPDLIITEIMLPEMNGRDMIHRLKDNPATKDIKILVNSSLDIHDAMAGIQDQEIDEYLSKVKTTPSDIASAAERLTLTT